jgi:beta-xylosidase
LFFDDDGKAYLIYGSGKIKLVELNADLTGIKQGVPEKLLLKTPVNPLEIILC